MNSSGYFALSAVVIFVMLALRTVYRDRDAQRKEIAESLKAIPVSYRPEVCVEITATPVFKNKDNHLWVTVNLVVAVSPAAPQEEVISQLTPSSKQAIHLWALGLDSADDALNPNAYARLRASLLDLTADFAVVKRATVIAGPRGGKFKADLSASQRLLQACQTLDELRRMAEDLPTRFPGLYADKEWKRALNAIIDAETSRVKSPDAEFV